MLREVSNFSAMSFSAFEKWQTKREQIGLKTDHPLLGYSSEILY